ncbi:MAG: tRNA (N6-isopentenyl adenosine(37)-C2)-methylthiotransferase MiaB [Bdellovibrionales bacterium GWA2_49_15]|nr:MAG: tRNA (N6-isopentenyl adenosine(37)-C2)-methylthiotransferase MiaB [Bdellovibrionales bacterium GWA2_49_15]HAZ13719.1 tRNA (N6-isopentenyl adenosine(37)-C2)-methylthiotransferase MiaB [Bdellovibrionales bacterium]
MATGLGIRQSEVHERVLANGPNGSIVKMGELEFPPRKVWMKTFGCQMNYHDSERILSHLKDLNFFQTDELNEADLVLFNTCAVRDLANSKFYGQLAELKQLKKSKGGLVIGVGGCVAQTEGKELVKRYQHLDFAFGPDVIDCINDMVYRTYAGDSKFAINSWDRSDNFSIETKITHGLPQAFINIIKGCDKYCSYCIVPYTRGKEKSRKLQEVVTDARKLVEYQGIQEITLLGQNVNSYGKENKETLAALLGELDQIRGLELIRYTTSHPYDVSDELIAAHGSLKKLSKHLHLPVQSGSNSVLERMLREYSVEHYLNLLAKLRKVQPEIVITTDIIVGFVNETEAEFQDTLKLLDMAQFDFSYSYVYSQRNHTRSAKMDDTLTAEIKGERLRYLQKYQLDIQQKLRQSLIGQRFLMLVEGHGNMRGIKKWRGRTSCNRIVHFIPQTEDADYQWHWVEVEVTSATSLSCQGKLLRDYGKRPPHLWRTYGEQLPPLVGDSGPAVDQSCPTITPL